MREFACVYVRIYVRVRLAYAPLNYTRLYMSTWLGHDFHVCIQRRAGAYISGDAQLVRGASDVLQKVSSTLFCVLGES